MAETFSLSTTVLSYEDRIDPGSPKTSDPHLRSINRRTSVSGVTIRKGQTLAPTVPALSDWVVFDGTRALAADASTQYALTLVSTAGSLSYRLAWTGVGAAPAFRAARAVGVAGGTVDVALLPNQTIQLTSSLGAVFGAVQVGDDVLVPGASTGDSASPFNALNEGDWSVLAATSASVVLARSTSAVFSGVTQAGVAVSSNAQLQFFSSAGVQVDDTLDLVAGFAPSALRAYSVSAVTASRVDFPSALPLASQTVVPGVGGVLVYQFAKRWVRVESDQEISVMSNGTTDDRERVEPWVAADPERRGAYERAGVFFSLVLRNRSTAPANTIVMVAE